MRSKIVNNSIYFWFW